MAELLSGQITVTTAGTAVQGPSTPDGSLFALKALPNNAGTVYVGNDGADDVTSANGFPLDPGEGVVVDIADLPGQDLSIFWFDAATSGDKIAWLRLG